MPIHITIRGVPEDARDELATRAALKVQYMARFLRAQLERIAARPPLNTLFEGVRRRPEVSGAGVAASSIPNHKTPAGGEAKRPAGERTPTSALRPNKTLEAGRPKGYVDRMDTRNESDGLPPEPDKVYAIHVTRGNGPADPELAAALEEVYQASLRNPNSFHNNPEKHREALEGLGRVLAEWQEENGAFTEEEMARARALVSGENVRP